MVNPLIVQFASDQDTNPDYLYDWCHSNSEVWAEIQTLAPMYYNAETQEEQLYSYMVVMDMVEERGADAEAVLAHRLHHMRRIVSTWTFDDAETAIQTFELLGFGKRFGKKSFRLSEWARGLNMGTRVANTLTKFKLRVVRK